jgi:hypothetical protein
MLLRFSEEVRSHPALVEDIVRKCAAALQFAGPELRRNQTLAEFAWRFDS